MSEKILTDLELQSYIDEIIGDDSTNKPLAEEIARQHLKEQDELRELDIKLGPVEKIDYTRTSLVKGSQEARYEERKRAEREAVHEAINQTYLDLNSIIEVENKKLLISLLVKGYTDNMEKYKSYIESTFDKCFRKLIPNEIMKVWQKYSETMVPFPGFTYECTKDYGQSKTYRVNLDLPMYFRPELCTNLFREKYKDKVPKLEKSIVFFYYHKQLRTETEVKYANRLAGITTYYQLLKRKPYWYSLLIKELKEKNNWTWQDLY